MTRIKLHKHLPRLSAPANRKRQGLKPPTITHRGKIWNNEALVALGDEGAQQRPSPSSSDSPMQRQVRPEGFDHPQRFCIRATRETEGGETSENSHRASISQKPMNDNEQGRISVLRHLERRKPSFNIASSSPPTPNTSPRSNDASPPNPSPAPADPPPPAPRRPQPRDPEEEREPRRQ